MYSGLAVRKIIHIDMDAFYASVEQRDFPELRGRPVVVGGPAEGRGVVAAASYEARRFGIHSAMPSAQAKRLCPHAVFVKPRFNVYQEASQQIREIFRAVTPFVEPLSLDEAYLDVTENSWREPKAGIVAKRLKAQIKEETQLIASAGVGPSKMIAKLASDFDKPDGLVIIPPDQVDRFLRPLEVKKLWGVGKKTAQRLHELGLYTVEDVRRFPKEHLERLFGSFGIHLHLLAYGNDDRRVENRREAKSRGAERTFARDLFRIAQIEEVLEEHGSRLGEEFERTHRAGRTVTIKLRYSDFTTITRSRSFSTPIESAARIVSIAKDLLKETEAGRRPVRLVGVSLSNLVADGEMVQLPLFGDAELLEAED